MEPQFFVTPAEFRAWLEASHGDETELWVGFYRKATGRPSITWSESVDQALCFGWIDGVRKSVDADSYKIRFTPRRPRSIWSAVNIKRAKELDELGFMRPAGLAAFEQRTDDRSAIYFYEQSHAAQLDAEQERQLRANTKAWEFFSAQPASYRKSATWWVTSAKREDTRARRLATLIEDCANGKTVKALTRPGK